MDPPKLLESANERREDRDKNAKTCMFGTDGDWRGTSRRFLKAFSKTLSLVFFSLLTIEY